MTIETSPNTSIEYIVTNILIVFHTRIVLPIAQACIATRTKVEVLPANYTFLVGTITRNRIL